MVRLGKRSRSVREEMIDAVYAETGKATLLVLLVAREIDRMRVHVAGEERGMSVCRRSGSGNTVERRRHQMIRQYGVVLSKGSRFPPASALRRPGPELPTSNSQVEAWQPSGKLDMSSSTPASEDGS